MLEFLVCLPPEALGQRMLDFLELRDIIQLENAATNHKSQQLLKAILPYCPPIVVSDSWDRINFNYIVCNWFNKRRCHIQLAKIVVESLFEVDFENFVVDNITLCIDQNTSLNDIVPLDDLNISQRMTQLVIKGKQDIAVMEVLFSQLHNVQSLSLPVIKGIYQTQWLEQIKKIGQNLHELSIQDSPINFTMFKSIIEYCPCMEKLSLNFVSDFEDSNLNNFLECMVGKCQYLRSLDISITYPSSAEADADLTVFVENFPQLEELSLYCHQFTDQSVIALTQHCSRLKKLKLYRWGQITVASLITLSKHGLPLQELDIPNIRISSDTIAAQCAHALSRIRQLYESSFDDTVGNLHHAIPYMTGLRRLLLDNPEDHLLVPHLLLPGHCAGLESLTVGANSSICLQQLSELITSCCQLQKLVISCQIKLSYDVLAEMAHNCPHLQKIILVGCEVTEDGVLALAVHCRQLQEIDIPRTTVTEETIRQLVQHCRRLIKLRSSVPTKGKYSAYKIWSRRELRELRELHV